MDKLAAIQLISVICGMVLLILVLKNRAQVVLNFLVRVVLGAICMISLNDFLAEQEILLSVGLNSVSLLTVGTLGISGFALLYGIAATKFL